MKLEVTTSQEFQLLKHSAEIKQMSRENLEEMLLEILRLDYAKTNFYQGELNRILCKEVKSFLPSVEDVQDVDQA